MSAVRYQYIDDTEQVNVRGESWYLPFMETITTAINSFSTKTSFASAGSRAGLKLLGIEGDLKYGKRSLCEWTCIQADVDRRVRDGIVKCRPQMQQVPLQELSENLRWSQQPNKVRHILIVSCPARIEKNIQVFQQVEVICADYDNVHILFSRPDDCAPQISRSIQTDSVPWSRRPTDPGERVQEVFDLLQNLNSRKLQIFELLRKNKALELELQQQREHGAQLSQTVKHLSEAMQMLGQGREEQEAWLSQAKQNMREATQRLAVMGSSSRSRSSSLGSGLSAEDKRRFRELEQQEIDW